jgi:hypothetical protein
MTRHSQRLNFAQIDAGFPRFEFPFDVFDRHLWNKIK